jgi:hypothetical protein
MKKFACKLVTGEATGVRFSTDSGFLFATTVASSVPCLLSSGNRLFYLKGKAAGAWGCQLTCIQCRGLECVELWLRALLWRVWHVAWSRILCCYVVWRAGSAGRKYCILTTEERKINESPGPCHYVIVRNSRCWCQDQTHCIGLV